MENDNQIMSPLGTSAVFLWSNLPVSLSYSGDRPQAWNLNGFAFRFELRNLQHSVAEEVKTHGYLLTICRMKTPENICREMSTSLPYNRDPGESAGDGGP